MAFNPCDKSNKIADQVATIDRPAGVRVGSGPTIGGGVVLTLLGLVAYAGLLTVHQSTGTLTHTSLPKSLFWIGMAYIVYLAMLWWSERQRQKAMPTVWIGAIGFQLLLLFTTPTLSDDVYRYLWDGHVANHGVSPYAYPIDAPELDTLEVPIRALTNHAWMASPYLPAAQALFRTVAWLLPLQARSMQGVMVLVNLSVALLIVALLALAGLPRFRVAIYLWNPLVVVESAHGAHLDVWMILLTLLAAWFAFYRWEAPQSQQGSWRTSLQWVSPLALALATMTKIIPLLLLPVFYWVWTPRWRYMAIFGAIVALALIPAGMRAGWGLTGPLDGRGLFGALRVYGDQWNYNSGLFHWLEGLLQDVGLGLSPELATLWAKRFVALALLAVLLAAWAYGRHITSARQALRMMSLPLMAYALLTTTFHPWYLLVVVAFLPFLAPADGEPRGQWLLIVPWVYLSGAIFLSYLTYLDPLDLREYEWIRRTEWLPVLAFLIGAVAARQIVHRYKGGQAGG